MDWKNWGPYVAGRARGTVREADEEDILCRIAAVNRRPDLAPLQILPHIWARNTWSWGHNPQRAEFVATMSPAVRIDHRHLGRRWSYVKPQLGRL